MRARTSPLWLVAVLVVVVWRLGVFSGSHPAVRAGAGGTSFVGTTSQDLPISFSATADEVQDVTFVWSASCADGQTHSNTIELGGAAIDSGSFTASGVLDTGGLASVAGRISGGSASGRLSRSGATAFGTDCTDAGVTWTAHATG